MNVKLLKLTVQELKDLRSRNIEKLVNYPHKLKSLNWLIQAKEVQYV